MTSVAKSQSAETFWENIYRDASPRTSGRPSHVLERFAKNRMPGKALDLGCAKGDDVIWLAKSGWQTLGVDIAPSALRIAAANAGRNGVANRARFDRHDLAESFPEGTFDLVSAVFLQTPLDFPRIAVLRRAAASVSPSGLLLIASHQRVAPWSWSDPEVELPDAEARLAELDLDPDAWRRIFVGPIERDAVNADGRTAPVVDAVIALERSRPSAPEKTRNVSD